MTRVRFLVVAVFVTALSTAAYGQRPLTGTRLKTAGTSSTRMSIQFQAPEEVAQIELLLYQGKPDKALELALGYVEQTRKSGMDAAARYFARNALCVVYVSTREDLKAEQECTSATELMPSHWSAWNNRGTLRFLMDDLTGAQEDYQQALEHSGDKVGVVELITYNLSLLKFKGMPTK
jgi:tetratricopeptide (TPR) repeat protein